MLNSSNKFSPWLIIEEKGDEVTWSFFLDKKVDSVRKPWQNANRQSYWRDFFILPSNETG